MAGVVVRRVWGRVSGRGMPGYVLSPDLVIADGRGFVPLRYTNRLARVAPRSVSAHAR